MANELELIYNACCEVTGLDIKKNTRKRDFMYGRMIYYYFARKMTYYSFSKIGIFMGKDHATVIHAFNRYEEYKEYEDIRRIKDKVSSILPETYKIKKDAAQLSNEHLISRNRRLEKQISLLRGKTGVGYNSFLDEIDLLPSNLKQEFEKFKWLPFKKMQESREHYKMNIEHKPVY